MAQLKQGNFCPLIRKNCIQFKCSWYTRMRGLNPNTGQEVDEWSCAVTWMPYMSAEIAQKENQTGAAVESFRNEVVKANEINQQLYISSLQQGILPTTVTTVSQPIINTLPEGEQ